MATAQPSMLHLTCRCGGTLKFSVPGFSPSSVAAERREFDKAHRTCREKKAEATTMTEEDRLTYALQAQGPDEFPEGYYRHLAREHLAAEAGE